MTRSAALRPAVGGFAAIAAIGVLLSLPAPHPPQATTVTRPATRMTTLSTNKVSADTQSSCQKPWRAYSA